VCNTLTRLDSKQTCLRNRLVCFFYPDVSLFGSAPRKYSEASVHPAGAKRHSFSPAGPREDSLGAIKAYRDTLLHARPLAQETVVAVATHASTSQHHPGTLVNITDCSSAPPYQSRASLHLNLGTTPARQAFGSTHPSVAKAPLTLFLAYFMLRTGYVLDRWREACQLCRVLRADPRLRSSSLPGCRFLRLSERLRLTST
jgi:hypothetical protein